MKKLKFKILIQAKKKLNDNIKVIVLMLMRGGRLKNIQTIIPLKVLKAKQLRQSDLICFRSL